jgi:hypothetical protein
MLALLLSFCGFLVGVDCQYQVLDVTRQRTTTLALVLFCLVQFAMFHLGHPNILPVGDLGVRKVRSQGIYQQPQQSV